MSLLQCAPSGALAVGILLGPCLGAGANDFTINLKVQSGGHEQTAISGQSAAPPTFTAKAREVVWVQWSAVNGVSGTPLSDVTLHVFMDRGDARAAAPKPGPKSLYESALIQDFEPGGKSSGEFRMPMPEPGTYFVRVETIGAAKKLGKEAAAAMQVSVP
ncbi:MAG TPA: hypothetical protein VL127_04545 [Bryobacteraceae bacterium]|jgi:hypothetical protein|nr:hypothetical protein [Bryobacteraceae bacterium]